MELKFAAQKAQGGINKTSTIILMKKKPCKFVDFKSMKKKSIEIGQTSAS